MGDKRRVNRLRDLQRHLAPIDPIEQADPRTEEDWRQRDGELIDHARVEVLQDGIGTSGDPDILVPSDLLRLAQRALDAVIDEVEGSPAWALPGTAHLCGQDEDRRVEGSFFGPGEFSPVEHALAHDAHAGAVEGFQQDAVVWAGLTTFTQL